MIEKPFRRIIRPFWITGDNLYGGRSGSKFGGTEYVLDPDYAAERVGLVRGFKIIEQDLLRLLEYVEPSDDNLKTYSHRLYELLLRASTEFEANCKGILVENGYSKSGKGNLNITDYALINTSSKLSDYEVRLSIWRDHPKDFYPLTGWSTGPSLNWYRGYNSSKHDRNRNFEHANLENVLTAVAAVAALLFSQFYIQCFWAQTPVAMCCCEEGGWFSHEDSLFAIKPSQAWTVDECYDFDWCALRQLPDRFGKFLFIQ